MSEETEVIESPAPEAAEPEAPKTLMEAGDNAAEKVWAEDKPATEPESAPKPADQVPDDKGDGVLTDEDKKILADAKEGKIIPKFRLDEVLQKVKSYETFGTPEELKAMRDELAALKSAPKVTPPATVKAPEPTTLTPEQQEVKAEFLKLFPHLEATEKMLEDFKNLQKFKEQYEGEKVQEFQRQEQTYNTYINSATERIKAMAEEAGINVNDPINLEMVVDPVTRLLHSNPKWDTEFYQGRNPEVLKEVFAEFQKRIFSGAQRRTAAELVRDKKQQANLPKPPLKGGMPSTPPEKRAKSLEEAGERAFGKVMGE